jgi:phytoene synthase
MTTAIARENATKSGSLEESRDFCRELTKREARNFYYGLKLLPEPKRSAMYALYGYMRLVDDIADDDANVKSLEQRKGDLDAWDRATRQAMAAAGGGAEVPTGSLVWPAFVELVRDYGIPASIFEDMIAGQRQDLEPTKMANFQALYDYCYRVASVVGVASLYVFGFDRTPAAEKETIGLGVERGIAFQLTNILRDLREDAGRGRCYIPADELARFKMSAGDLARGEETEAFKKLMEFQVERARGFYERSAALEGRIQGDAVPTLTAMTAIYRGLLEKIAVDPTRVLRGRVRLSSWAKLRIGWRAMRART